MTYGILHLSLYYCGVLMDFYYVITIPNLTLYNIPLLFIINYYYYVLLLLLLYYHHYYIITTTEYYETTTVVVSSSSVFDNHIPQSDHRRFHLLRRKH